MASSTVGLFSTLHICADTARPNTGNAHCLLHKAIGGGRELLSPAAADLAGAHEWHVCELPHDSRAIGATQAGRIVGPVCVLRAHSVLVSTTTPPLPRMIPALPLNLAIVA